MPPWVHNEFTAESFDDWFRQLEELAEGIDWELGEPESYTEYFDDGDTPEQALDEEIAAADLKYPEDFDLDFDC